LADNNSWGIGDEESNRSSSAAWLRSRDMAIATPQSQGLFMGKLILITLTLFTMAGCMATYVAPDGEDTANLILPVKESIWKSLGGSSYVHFGYADDSGCGKYLAAVPPEREGDKEVVVKIPADRDIFIGHFAHSGNYNCEIHESFKPKAGATYKVLNMGNGMQCFLGVVEVNNYLKDEPIELSDEPIELSSVKYNQLTKSVCMMNEPGESYKPSLPRAVSGTATDSELQSDITQQLFVEASKYHHDCEHNVLKAEVYNSSQHSVIASEAGGESPELEQRLRDKDQMLVETWFVKSCDTVDRYEVLLLRAGTGTDIMVKKLEPLQ
jgi:hypothetical protein